jgi:hypothetical protein
MAESHGGLRFQVTMGANAIGFARFREPSVIIWRQKNARRAAMVVMGREQRMANS